MKYVHALFYFLAALIIHGCTPTHSQQFAQDSQQDATVISLPATQAPLSIMGRTHIDADQSYRFGFPGVSFSTQVIGRTLTADMQSSSGNSWIDIVVDHQHITQVKLGQQQQTVELFNFPVSGKHTVEIIHRSENWHGSVSLKQLTLTGDRFLPAPALPQRKLLVMGDSVTCGEAIDRVPGEEKNTHWWNARESYGMLTANALNAQVHLVCWGGRGLVRSWNGKTDDANLPDFYEFALGDSDATMRWNHNNYQPDVIVIAIGTNDFSQGIPAREVYVTAYVALINTLLHNHPHAQIALTDGAILNGEKKAALIDYLRETISRVNNARVHQLISNHYPGDVQDAHPTKAQHAAMAKDLAPQLKALMHW
ncbi:xylan esterase [Cellvibrio mixtus]|uniref:Xylan esterase n=1 Tax=Cellvibrio mixtus TaxID=39650 RepID=A0A266Q2T0_9GAMM|nr:bifunctional acetylxylan esterase/glucomannan deacetylase AxeC2 [Cellvibrio mixtus]OZY83669.1 xylan esterase [Cellvibrio mixtus]